MTEEQFWCIIAESHEGDTSELVSEDQQRQVKRLKELLRPLTIEGLLDFDDILAQTFFEADRWDLMAAATIINIGCCSDDGFMDFRYWLISMGKAVYEDALIDPDSLANVRVVQIAFQEPYSWRTQFGDCGYVVRPIYEEKTGEEMPLFDYGPSVGTMGEEFDFDDGEEMNRRFPKLMAAYRESPRD
jgi:hypothetical protein